MSDGADSFLDGGWKSLIEQQREPKEVTREVLQGQYESALVIARPFMGKDGAASLAALAARTTENVTWDPELGANAVNHGFFREGQNSIVRFIRACMETVEKGPPVADEKPAAPDKRKPVRATVRA